MAALLAMLTVCGGGYYLWRLAPRVMARAAVNEYGGAAASSAAGAHLRYRAHEHAFQPVMNEREALLVLGFDSSEIGLLKHPSKEEIHQRYRLLMTHLHSDVEGSAYVATKINEARDILK